MNNARSKNWRGQKKLAFTKVHIVFFENETSCFTAGDFMSKKVVVSGIGLITPIGTGKDKFWEAAKNGTNGV
jgi:hypothetical protein